MTSHAKQVQAMAEGLAKPDFIIAGSAKSGTTALYQMFDQHPDISMSSVKETNYFVQGFEQTRELIWHNGRRVVEHQREHDIIDSAEKYAALFSAGRTALCGEASPWYLLNSRVPARIAAHNPEAKVIIMLRNPSDVAFANLVHQIRDRAESLGVEQLESVLDEQHYSDDRLHPFSYHLDLPRYARHLPAYLQQFDQQQLMILVYEEFLQDRRAALSRLFDFLGARDDVEINMDAQVNISGMPRSELLQTLLQGSMAFKRAVGLFVPKKVRNRTRARIEALNTGEKLRMPPGLRSRLDALYQTDVDYVEALLGRELSCWREKRLPITPGREASI